MKNNDMEKNMMDRGERLLDAIGDIKDEYIVEASAANIVEFKASKPKSKRRMWMKVASVAAVMVLCVGVGSIAIRNAKFAPAVDEYALHESEASGTAPIEKETSEGISYESPVEGVLEESSTAINTVMEPTEEAEVEESREDDYTDDTVEPDETMLPIDYPQGEAFVLTAAQWNDNANWPFFVNLVNSGRISFPSYGIDPRNRIKVTLLNEDGSDWIKNESVYLMDEGGNILWQTRSNKEGVAYLFYEGGAVPFSVEAGGTTLNIDSIAYNMPMEPIDEDDQQGTSVVVPTPDDIVIHLSEGGEATSGVQVMFIVDTTGSMSDELSYLQMDFSQIAADAAGEGVVYSANFYRDEGDAYVTKTNGFTSDVAAVQRLISEEYAAGGGDTPEAVADILYETITANAEWRSDMNKVCFLIFDAPPHYGTEGRIAEAVKSAAARGIHVVPVVASNAERETELFGRALAITTDGEYVFLTDHSGVGHSHLEPIVGDYDVELLHDIIVRIINNYK